MASRCLNSDITVYNLYMFAWSPCTLFFVFHVQGILNLIGRFLLHEPQAMRCRRHGNKRRKHCMKCNSSQPSSLYTMVHQLLLQRPAVRRAIGLVTMATFIVLTLYALAAPLGAYCHKSPVLDCAFVYTCSGTALHDPLQHCTNASQKDINQFVFCEHADINRLKTTYLRYRKSLRRIFLYTSKRRFHRPACLAWLLLLLLLCGDVEVNPGPTTSKECPANEELNVFLVEDTSAEEEQKLPDSFEQYPSGIDGQKKKPTSNFQLMTCKNMNNS